MQSFFKHARVFALALALSCCALLPTASAAPPYDVEVTLTAPVDGGPVDSYVLYVDDVSQGAIATGVTNWPGLITADGTYVFEVAAVNAAGETRSAPVTVTVNELELPGQPTIQIQVSCDPCVLTISP